MLKRIAFFCLGFLFLLCCGLTAVYFINPHNVESENLRPRLFGFDIYRIPSKSMLPLLSPGDYIAVSVDSHEQRQVSRGDVIVFYRDVKKAAKSESDLSKIPFIKRVVGISGDTVKIRSGQLYINNQHIAESYVKKQNNQTPYSQNMLEKRVLSGHVFLLGDNRDNSADSRLFGAIPNKQIIGQATDILYGVNNRTGTKIK